MKRKLILYFRKPAEKYRWFPGDHFIRKWIRRIIRGKSHPGGVEKVFINLCKGLDILKVPYVVNLPFDKIQPNDKIAILGAGKYGLEGYNKTNKIVAGIGLMTHPSEWPDLCITYPVIKYLQHSDWANQVYVPYFGNKCEIWPVGVETEKWKPNTSVEKDYDVLIYNKIRWNKEQWNETLRIPIIEYLNSKNIKTTEIIYGSYKEERFQELLNKSKSMIFLCEHESQGIACCETLATDIPVFAWDNGFCLDPNRFKWGQPEMPATSVPYFDERCGMKFKDFPAFEKDFDVFMQKVTLNKFRPREYIIENLSLEKSAQKFLEIINHAYS